MKFIENLEWRYATKMFDSGKKVSSQDLEEIKQSVQLSASSYGLQLYKVLIIKDEMLKERLKPYSWNQNKITNCSDLFVFCNYTNVSPEDIDEYIRLKSKIQQISIETIEGYGDFIKMKLAEKSEVERKSWLIRQTYLALGNLLTACAELKIDACPMEGFEPESYNQILGLKEKGLNACVIATIGYRHPEDETQHEKKVRKPIDLLFEEI